ncbi:MAG TPA: hypothetical protein PLI21_03920, partial [Methanomassiliicoccaceae archaeon]|nr:hypothetical protein [Methanomassiliicoccaceae archaeon]
LSVVWGLHCVVTGDAESLDDMVNRACRIVVSEEFGKPGDRIIIMAFEITDRPIVPNIVLVDERNRKVKTLHAPGPSVSE